MMNILTQNRQWTKIESPYIHPCKYRQMLLLEKKIASSSPGDGNYGYPHEE